VNQELNTYRYPPPRCFHLLLVWSMAPRWASLPHSRCSLLPYLEA
jgi:hypothetical protein